MSSYEVKYERNCSDPEWVLYERAIDGGLSSMVAMFFREETARACATWLEERKLKNGNKQESDDHC